MKRRRTWRLVPGCHSVARGKRPNPRQAATRARRPLVLRRAGWARQGTAGDFHELSRPALPVRRCRNRIRIFAYILLGLATISSTARSRVKILSDPGFLLGDTRDWSRASPLGDLRERPTSND